MKYQLTLSLLLLTSFLPVTIMANTSGSKMTSNLGLVIHPKYDDETSFVAAQKVCACVDKKAKDAWSKNKYETLEKELHQYSIKMDNYFNQSNLDVILLAKSGLPAPSSELQKQLKSISPLVSICENELDIEVEF